MSLIIIWLAAITDLFWGDPNYRFHPVRMIGSLIQQIETLIRKRANDEKKLKKGGIVLTIIVVGSTYLITYTALQLFGKIHYLLEIFLSIFLIYSFLALQSLIDAAKEVKRALHTSLTDARFAISMIVGRDTQSLNEEGITKATVETVAENCVDGIIAPLFFLFIGGVPLMAAYKAINTLDSMVGYQNEKYQNLGWCSAKLDDVVNYIPARLSLIFITLAALIMKMDYKNALKIGIRDRYQHKSPNSAWSEAAVAGALNIQLGGGNYYHGKYVDKPTIGDAIQPVRIDDIDRTNHLIYATSTIALVCFSLVSLVFTHAL